MRATGEPDRERLLALRLGPALVMLGGDTLWTLALVCYFGGRGELWAPLHTSMARLSPAPPPLLSLTIDMFADPARTGVAALPRLRAALDVVHDEVARVALVARAHDGALLTALDPAERQQLRGLLGRIAAQQQLTDTHPGFRRIGGGAEHRPGTPVECE